MRRKAFRWIAPLTVLVLFLAGRGTTNLQAQEQTTALGEMTSSGSPWSQTFTARREGLVLLLGSSLHLTGRWIVSVPPPVSPRGLDPAGIRWGLDRRTIGDLEEGANRASDWTRLGSLALPVVISTLVPGGRGRAQHVARAGAVYAEALLLAQGATFLTKQVIGRARPYAFVPADLLPGSPSYATQSERTFRSMPSGHASAAWVGAATGMTQFLLSSPDATPWQRRTVGFAGGLLAGATASLRVEAGQHFPTDVVAGSMIGIAAGVALPLLHREGEPPSGDAWVDMAGGALLGALLGAFLGQEL